MLKTWYILDLQLFAEGAAGSAGAGTAGGEAGESADGAVKAEAAAPRRAKAANPLANVQYGEPVGNEDAAGPGTQKEAKSFEDLIKGEYREDFNKRVQQVIDKRFSETKKMEAERAKVQPILTLLADKYGKEVTDVQGIVDAMNEDDELYEARAMDRGMTASQYRELMKVTAENQELRARQEEAQRRTEVNNIIQGWRAQAEQLRQTLYPGLDFDQEMANPEVQRLLSQNLDFKTVFQVVHMNDIMQGTIGYAVQKTRENVTNNIRSRQQRPVENGVRNAATGTVKRHASDLTKADRAEIARRVASGERSAFKLERKAYEGFL